MNRIEIQEKTDEELNKIASKIIDLLSDLNYADKYKIISSLHDSLVDTIKSEGGVIQVQDLEELQDFVDGKESEA